MRRPAPQPASSTASAPAAPAPLRPSGFASLALAIIVTVTTLAYANTFQVPFQCDDVISIIDNPTIRTLWPLSRVMKPASWGATTQGRPILNLSLALNFHFGRLNVVGYHVVNLLIHLTAASLLFLLARRMLRLAQAPESLRRHADGLACTIALLWALHPMNTQAVTYVAQRVEAMMAVCYLLTLYLVCRCAAAVTAPAGRTARQPTTHRLFPAPPRLWAAAAILACAIGMATKEVMISAPIIALLMDRGFLAPTWRELFCRRGWLYAGLAATWGVLLYLVLTQGEFRAETTGFGSAVSPWHYLLTQAGVILRYLRLAIWPRPLSFDYSDLPLVSRLAEAWPEVSVVAALFAVTLALWRSHPRLGWLGLTFFAVLAPTSSVMPIMDLMQERRMYLPLMPLVALIVLAGNATLQRLPDRLPRRQLAMALVAVLAATLGLSTFVRNRVYRSEYELWMDVLHKRPQNTQAAVTAGACLMDQGRLQDAMTLFNRAVAANPHGVMSYNNRGIAHLRLQQFDLALADFTSALAYPGLNHFYVLNNRGNTYVAMGNTAAALADYSAAIAAMPYYARAYYNRARLLESTGDIPSALTDYAMAIRYAPERPETYVDYGNLLASLGRLTDAIDSYSRAIRYAPDNADAYYNRANSLAQLQHFDQALPDYTQALNLRPDKAQAYNNRASVYLILGDPARARQDLESCQRLGLAPNEDLVRMVNEALAAPPPQR